MFSKLLRLRWSHFDVIGIVKIEKMLNSVLIQEYLVFVIII